ncbi:hypothetical protein BC834DRAFT_609719 [Gloeopeniophorella convolvens]|nr:hypothetical protein BC834DRAFT_609719 [Gloeopeniophorella convolvens]
MLASTLLQTTRGPIATAITQRGRATAVAMAYIANGTPSSEWRTRILTMSMSGDTVQWRTWYHRVAVLRSSPSDMSRSWSRNIVPGRIGPTTSNISVQSSCIAPNRLYVQASACLYVHSMHLSIVPAVPDVPRVVIILGSTRGKIPLDTVGMPLASRAPVALAAQ